MVNFAIFKTSDSNKNLKASDSLYQNQKASPDRGTKVMVSVENAKAGIGSLIKQRVKQAFIPGYWKKPNVSLLSEDNNQNQPVENYEYPINPEEIVNVLSRYGVRASVEEIKIGSSVITYEIKLPVGSESSKLIKRTEDMARDLQQPSLRILPSIPGTPHIGVEVPNNIRSQVSFKKLAMNLPEGQLMVALGEDTYGENVYMDLTDAPHLLVAGTTGSGKSVWLNVAISSLLCTKGPNEVKFLMVDPKRVELKFYESIPHLAKPIAHEAEDADLLLDYALEEMEHRFMLLEKSKCRDIKTYNAFSVKKIPYIVFVIDEFSDLIMTAKYKKIFEDKVIRLAQKARAVGIHMILATQKPLKEVVTSLIKSNLPSRISFQVASNMDSRTVLDEGGAEKLLGKGDMLIKTTRMNMKRVQAAWISDEHILSIVGGKL